MNIPFTFTKNPLLLFVLFAFSIAFAQKPVDTLRRGTTNIISYDDFIAVRIGASNNFNNFVFKDRAKTGRYTLAPNQQIKTVATIAYKFVEIDLGYTPNFLKYSKSKKSNGTTDYFNLGTRFYVGRLMQNIDYSKTTGYYIKKGKPSIVDEIEKPFTDMQVIKVGGSTSYIFNCDFSFRAIYKQNEWQKHSAGSFVPTFNYYYTQLSYERPGVNKIIDLVAGPGYYYNWVIANEFLVSAGVYGGIGYNNTHTTYKDDTPNDRVEGISYQFNYQASVAYNSTHFYTGAGLNVNSFYHKLQSGVNVTDRQNYFEFYMGYRFQTSNKITREISKVGDEYGL